MGTRQNCRDRQLYGMQRKERWYEKKTMKTIYVARWYGMYGMQKIDDL